MDSSVIGPRLASQNSREESYVYFINTTTRRVFIYWMDFNGHPFLYTILTARNAIKANTFVTHPWIFRDSMTGETLHVEHQDVFWPQKYQISDPQNREVMITSRKAVYIHLPVRQLREICLWETAKYFRGANEAYLNNLTIPKSLLTELKHILRRIENHRLLRA